MSKLQKAIQMVLMLSAFLLTPSTYAQTISELRTRLNAAWNSKDWRTAEELSLQILRLPESGASDKRTLAIAVDAQGRKEEAFLIRKELADSKSANHFDLTYSCWHQLEVNKPIEARPYCDRVTKESPEKDKHYENLGHTFWFLGDVEKAKVLYKQALESYASYDSDVEKKILGIKEDFDYFINKHKFSGHLSEIKVWFVEYVAVDKRKRDDAKRASEKFKEANSKANSGDFKAAIRLFDEALILDPLNYFGFKWRADSRNKVGDYLGAAEDYSKALHLAPQEPSGMFKSYDVKFLRANAFAKFGDAQRAMQDYTAAIAVNPKDGDSLRTRGILKDELKDYTGAIEDYTAAIAVNPKDGDSLRFRGSAKASLKDYTGAIEDYTAAIAVNPKDGHSIRSRGFVKNTLKDHIGATEDYTAALAVNPKDGASLRFRASVKNTLKDYTGAIEDYTAAIAVNPKDGDLLRSRGSVKNSLKDYTGAIEDHTAAIAVNPKDVNSYLNRVTSALELCKITASNKSQYGATAISDLAYLNNPSNEVAVREMFAEYLNILLFIKSGEILIKKYCLS
ncbi:MAG TPA: tetratricopeptide repeat protein [Casimicrobium sp.]|nr:tetratricopeptide repeat protein [Casimicrobium sp.]